MCAASTEKKLKLSAQCVCVCGENLALQNTAPKGQFWTTLDDLRKDHQSGATPLTLPPSTGTPPTKTGLCRPDSKFVFWEGKTVHPLEDVTLINCGGHFLGSSVLHWADGAEDRGVLLTGDTITVVADNRYVTFMYSYPNQIPLSDAAVKQIVGAVEPYNYDRIYGGWFDSIIPKDAKEAVNRSAQRYLQINSGR